MQIGWKHGQQQYDNPSEEGVHEVIGARRDERDGEPKKGNALRER